MLGEVERAREVDEDTLTRRRRVLGDDHRDTLASASNPAADLRWLGEHERARQLDEDTLARSRRVLGDDHPDTLTSAGNVAADLRLLGEHEQARQLDEEVQRRTAGTYLIRWSTVNVSSSADPGSRPPDPVLPANST